MQRTHRPCPFCKSSDGFSYNTNTGLFLCFVCEAKPTSKRGLCYDGENLTPFGENNQEFEEEGMILEPYVRKYRSINEDTLEFFGSYFDKYNNKERVHHIYPNAHKIRTLPKAITTNGVLDHFFGSDKFNSGKTITITEGEEDAMSVFQMMGNYPVVSVPGANPSGAFWNNAKEYLKNFEKIVLSIDNDKPGDELARKFFHSFPNKVYRVNHGKFKDANEFLEEGEREEYKRAWWNAPKMRLENVNSTSEDFISLYKDTPNYEYFPTGIKELDEKILGIHKGAFTLVLAPTGIGKTEFFRYLEYQCYSTTKYSIAFCHGEETELRSMLGLVSYELNDNLTRKDLVESKFREEEVIQTLDKMGESSRIKQFKIGLDDTVDDIVNKVRFLATAMEVDYFFIEPIQDFISGDTSSKENQLTDLTNKLKRMAPDLNIGIVVIAHANEDGDAKYCKSITQGAAYEIVLSRDRESTDETEKNRTYVEVGRKNRVGGGSGPAGSLQFDSGTYTLTPNTGPVEPKSPKAKASGDKPVADSFEIPF